MNIVALMQAIKSGGDLSGLAGALGLDHSSLTGRTEINDAVVALATATLPEGVQVVRLSGSLPTGKRLHLLAVLGD